VRLSTAAVAENALSIAGALRLTADEVAPTSLPIHYSYGLSVVNSHLAVGATLVVTGDGLMTRRFWEAFDAHRCTSLAGVPYSYQMLGRLRFDVAQHPSLRTMTQAGGRLGVEDARRFWTMMDGVGGRFHVMYGQTEATARMAVLPHERFVDKAGSAGLAVPGGRFEVLGDSGQLVYVGPNVMMGYAIGGADLWKDDELRGRLYTGDIGEIDDEGFVFLSGRAARFAKVFGVRVSLDDVEDLVRSLTTAAAVSGNDRVVVFGEGVDDPKAVAKLIAERLRVHPSGVEVREIDHLPLLPNGKIDYRSLEAAA
jgi:acyl-coenzyme A synthetase/AMP-(fatty) acid ligase